MYQHIVADNDGGQCIVADDDGDQDIPPESNAHGRARLNVDYAE